MKSKSTLFDPPPTLGKDGAALWKRLVEAYAIDDPAGRTLLRSACESADRVEMARALVEKHGALITDRWGQLKVNPATVVERDARASMLAALKALALDLEPSREPGRPPNRS